MTEIILKQNEFIIKLNNDISKLILGEESPKLQLINPHKEGEYDYNSFLVLKELLSQLSKIKGH